MGRGYGRLVKERTSHVDQHGVRWCGAAHVSVRSLPIGHCVLVVG